MIMIETAVQQREAWIASLDAIAALSPKIVVAGHKPVGAPDGPENIHASQQYPRDFTRVANESDSAQSIVEGMLALHGGRVQPHTLYVSANAEIARRG